MRLHLLFLAAVPVLWAQSTWQTLVAEKQWAAAEPILIRALDQTPDSVPELEALAQLYRATGRLVQADPVLDHLVAVSGTVPHVEAAARVKAGLGELDRARELYERALTLRLDTDATPLTAIPTRRLLAQVLVAQKNFRDAAQQALIAISVRTRALGDEHPDLAGDYAVLARIHQAQLVWQEAAKAWEQVVRVQTAAYGADDLRVADSLLNLGLSYGEFRQFDQAEASFRRALAVRQVNLGANHLDIAEVTDALGKLLYSAGRFSDAEPQFERSLEIFLGFLGPGNPLLTRNYDNLAVTEAALQKWSEAADHYREALKIRDADSALNLRHLGLVETALEHPEAASALYRRAIEILELPGNSNPVFLADVRKEFEEVQGEAKAPIISKQAPKGKRAPVTAKQK